MQISLNQMVEMLADFCKRPFDIPLQEELKLIFNIKRAEYLHKILEKNIDQRKYFLKYISDDLVEVDELECPLPESGCTVKRTSKQIPLPLRTSYALFDYVGTPDKTDGYTYVTPDQLPWMVEYGSRYTKDRPKWFYVNKYIYIYNEEGMDYLTIGGVWTDPRALSAFKCDDVACYTDDDQYDVPDDILNTMIQDIIKNELKLLLSPDDTEVTVDNEDVN